MKSEQTKQQYLSAKKEYVNLLKSTKQEYFKKVLESSNNKNRTVWQLVRTEMASATTIDKISLKIDGEVVSEQSEVAEAFAKYFSSVNIMSINDHFGGNLSTSCTTSSLSNDNFFLFPVLAQEVEMVIKGLKNKNSSGMDMISVKVMKSLAPFISEHLAYLINLSVTSGKFPSVLKTAKVIPVHKKNDADDISNYRPISLLSCLSKVIERIIYDRMLNYLNKLSVITSCQHGFTVNRSTETAACELVDCVHGNLDDGLCVAGLFFDESRAFDCLNFNFILDKLYNLGFRGVFLKWIESFLTDRWLYARVGQHDSSKYAVRMGVPQGSVLGPLLFTLFVNDLPNNIVTCYPALTDVKIILFADDTSFIVSAATMEELRDKCKLLVECFTEWCHKNCIILNVNKTDVVLFNARDSDRRLVLSLQSGELKSSDCVRFLGLQVDSGLGWHQHTDTVCRKLCSAYFALRRLKPVLSLDSLMNVYFSLVYTHLKYCVVVWGGTSVSNAVFIAQKKIIRMIFDLKPRESCRPIFVQNNLMSLPSLYIYDCLLYTKKNIHLLKKCSQFHEYNTRNKETICIPKHRTSRFENSPTYSGMKLFNHLPDRLKVLDYKSFKQNIKKILLERCFYSNHEYFSSSIG